MGPIGMNTELAHAIRMQRHTPASAYIWPGVSLSPCLTRSAGACVSDLQLDNVRFVSQHGAGPGYIGDIHRCRPLLLVAAIKPPLHEHDWASETMIQVHVIIRHLKWPVHLSPLGIYPKEAQSGISPAARQRPFVAQRGDGPCHVGDIHRSKPLQHPCHQSHMKTSRHMTG